MKSLRELAINQLPQWEQPTLWQRRYELRLGEDRLARLRWQNFWGSVALGESQEERWRFQSSLWSRHRLRVQQLAPAERRATFAWLRADKGELHVEDGPRFVWIQLDGRGQEWGWRDHHGEQLLHLEVLRSFGKLKPRVRLVLKPAARHHAWLPLLVLLGFHLYAHRFYRLTLRDLLDSLIRGL